MTTKTKDGATARPWTLGNSIHEFKDTVCWNVPIWADGGPENGKIAAEAIAPTREMARTNAELIVTAVNAHDELVAALDNYTLCGTAKERKPMRECLQDALAALAKVRK